jgi:hypothetical protein
LLSDRQLRQAIADLQAMERKCFGSRQRYAFYGYLSEVFAFYERLRRKTEAKSSANRIAELFGIKTQKRTHSIRIIIDVTSAAELKMKSRWARALRFAWRERSRWKSLIAFFGEVGGPAGAAARWSALHVRNSSHRGRRGGDDIVRRIPLIVAVEPVKPEELFVEDGRVFMRPDISNGGHCEHVLTNEGTAREMAQRKDA